MSNNIPVLSVTNQAGEHIRPGLVLLSVTVTVTLSHEERNTVILHTNTHRSTHTDWWFRLTVVCCDNCFDCVTLR